MNAALKVPTIFSAVDKFSSVVKGMSKSVSSFSEQTQAEIARVQRSMRKTSEVTKNIAIGTGAVGTAILAPLGLAVKAASDYETSIASLSAITGATGTELQKFKQKVEEVADAQKMAYGDTAKAFELAGSAMPELLKSADALGIVSTAAITLSKASGEDLESSIRSLTGVMNQFSLGATQSERTINVLAAGAKVGAATIAQTSESMVNFGSVAAGANMSLEQTVGMIQVMSKYSLFGAEAGTKLRGSVLKLQQAGVGYASGQFKVNDALLETKKNIEKLKTAKEKDAALQKIFGAENISTGKILLNNISLLDEYTKGVTGTSEATIQAGTKSQTLAKKMEAMKNSVANLAIKIGEVLLPIIDKLADKVLPVIKGIADWVKANPKLTQGLVYAAAAIGLILVAMSAITGIISIVTGFIASISGLGAAWVAVSTFMTMNIIPIFQLVGAVFSAIGIGIMAVIGFIISLLFSLYRNWDRIVSAFQNGGIIEGLKAIGTTIMDAILWPLQKVLELASKLPKFLGGGLAADAAASVKDFRASLGVEMGSDAATATPAINTRKTNQDAMTNSTESIMKEIVTINFAGMPKGVTVESSNNSSGILQPQLTSTRGF